MRVQVAIPGSEDKTPAQLERVLAQCFLADARRFGALAARRVVATKQMEDICFAQICRAMRLAVLIHKQRKSDSELFAELPREIHSSQTDRDDVCAPGRNLLLVVTQLRDMLAAEDSAPMPQKDDHRRLALP